MRSHNKRGHTRYDGTLNRRMNVNALKGGNFTEIADDKMTNFSFFSGYAVFQNLYVFPFPCDSNNNSTRPTIARFQRHREIIVWPN